MPIAEVDGVARGRVYTGAQALDLGLVDELGGLFAATAYAKRALGMDVEAEVELVPYPPPRSLLEEIAAELEGGAIRGRGLELLEGRLESLSPWLRALADGAPVELLPFPLEVH